MVNFRTIAIATLIITSSGLLVSGVWAIGVINSKTNSNTTALKGHDEKFDILIKQQEDISNKVQWLYENEIKKNQ